MLLYTRTIIQTKMTPRTIVTISHSVRNAGDSFSALPATSRCRLRQKIEPLAISLLSAEAPTRLSELKARIGEPRWSIEAIKPMPISTHKPNMQAITRCWASARRSPLSSAKARTIKPPATHCPKTVKIISYHSCHPLPISHLLRVCQIASGIPGRAAIGIGFDHNIRFGKVSSRQRRKSTARSPCFYAARR